MKKILLATMCVLGATLAVPAVADGDRGRRHDRYDQRYDHRHDHRHHNRFYRHDSRRYQPVRYVVHGRYCDDRRHYRSTHYHVPSRYYYASGYPRHAYRVHGRSGIDATLIVTLPLF